jgi:hypothetical protein
VEPVLPSSGEKTGLTQASVPAGNTGIATVFITSSLVHIRVAANSKWHALVMPRTPASPVTVVDVKPTNWVST